MKTSKSSKRSGANNRKVDDASALGVADAASAPFGWRHLVASRPSHTALHNHTKSPPASPGRGGADVTRFARNKRVATSLFPRISAVRTPPPSHDLSAACRSSAMAELPEDFAAEPTRAASASWATLVSVCRASMPASASEPGFAARGAESASCSLGSEPSSEPKSSRHTA
eukprot:scaffold239099_cov28-Tisochrysis_lutea.AAC.3